MLLIATCFASIENRLFSHYYFVFCGYYNHKTIKHKLQRTNTNTILYQLFSYDYKLSSIYLCKRFIIGIVVYHKQRCLFLAYVSITAEASGQPAGV